MATIRAQLHKHRHLLWAMVAAGLCLCLAMLIWLVSVRPNVDKSYSERVSDNYDASTPVLEDGQTLTQTFMTDSDLLALAFVFKIPEEQPTGELDLVLADADTGEVLATSTGEMQNIVPDQYIGLGLDHAVGQKIGRRYAVSLTPHYTGGGRLALGCSESNLLWQSEDTLTLAGVEEPLDATLSLILTTVRVGGFLTRFFLLVALGASVLVFLGIWLSFTEHLALHRLIFVLVLGFGMLYSFVLPPYAAPDEKYHINQSFTLACQIANRFSDEEWRMTSVPTTTTYRRETDVDGLLQDENTTVFTWKRLAEHLKDKTDVPFDNHMELHELQTDTNPLPYLISGFTVFLCYLLHLGFAPTLLLGRLANLVVFAVLAALAVKWAPCGRRVFAAAALLPMTLHLAVSFSRDSLLLGLCFAFAALCLDAVCSAAETKPLPLHRIIALFACGILLAPAKAVYLPLAALVLLVPGVRLGKLPLLKKLAYVGCCVLLTVSMNTTVLVNALGVSSAEPHSRAPRSAPNEAVASVEETPKAAPETAEAPAEAAPSTEATETAPTEDVLAAYEASIAEHTLENFVRRLYFYAEHNADPSPSEIDFWVQAMLDGDTTPAELSQSFFFSPAMYENGFPTGDDFVIPFSMAYFAKNITAEPGMEYLLDQYAIQDALYCKFIWYYCNDIDYFGPFGIADVGWENSDYYPFDRNAVLVPRIEAARAARLSQSVATVEDSICYTPGYILSHLPDTVFLVVRSLIENGDHYLRTLVGGCLSYYSLDLAWGWVILLYLLLVFAAFPSQQELEGKRLPHGFSRVWIALAALACCGLTVAGCLSWTPIYYDTIYGMQGRYFLPVLPMLLLTCMPRSAVLPREDTAAAQLVTGLCLANIGVLVNAMLAIIAR